MFPLVGIPNSVISGLKGSRRVFCREAGFKHIGRYISGLLLSPNKTLQGILMGKPSVVGRCMNRFLNQVGASVS